MEYKISKSTSEFGTKWIHFNDRLKIPFDNEIEVMRFKCDLDKILIEILLESEDKKRINYF